MSFDNIKIKEHPSGEDSIVIKSGAANCDSDLIYVTYKTGVGGTVIFRFLNMAAGFVEVYIEAGGNVIDNISFYIKYDPNDNLYFTIYNYLNRSKQENTYNNKGHVGLLSPLLSPMSYIYTFDIGNIIENIGNITSQQVENVGD